DPLDDDRGRRKRQRDVGIEDAAGRLIPVLARIPGERREDDLLHQAAHLRVEDRPRYEPPVHEDLSEARAALLGHRLQRPVEVRVGDAAAATQEGADALTLPRGGRRAQLPLLEEEMPGLVAVDERKSPLEPLEKDPAQYLRQGRLGQGAPKTGRLRLGRHWKLKVVA